MQPLDLGLQVVWVITDKKPVIMNQIGVGKVIDAVVIEILDHVMPREAAAGDDAIADIGLL